MLMLIPVDPPNVPIDDPATVLVRWCGVRWRNYNGPALELIADDLVKFTLPLVEGCEDTVKQHCPEFSEVVQSWLERPRYEVHAADCGKA